MIGPSWPRSAAATLVLLILGTGAARAAVSPPPGAPQLQGTFALSGQITVAVHVNGEYAGQTISRTWTFQPQCATGPCAALTLIRPRGAGSDTLTLSYTAAGSYVGNGDFYAPLRCGGRIHKRGELVPFTVSVRVTATTESPTGPVATSIAATYTNPSRQNLTRCVLPPSHDAAVYQGQLEPGG